MNVVGGRNKEGKVRRQEGAGRMEVGKDGSGYEVLCRRAEGREQRYGDGGGRR